MTKKHFIALADHIRTANDICKFGGIPPTFGKLAIDTLSAFCRSQNGNFNRERWLDYIDGKCGPSGGKVKK